MKYESFGIKDLGWNTLVGKTVEKMEVNSEKDVIKFSLLGGEVIYASAIGEYCSRSWFEHLEGEDALIGHPVLGVVEREMSKPIDKTGAPDYGELTEFYGWTIETARGRFDIEMRNESNGYYGGKVIVSDVISDQYYSERDEPFAAAPRSTNAPPRTAGERNKI